MTIKTVQPTLLNKHTSFTASESNYLSERVRHTRHPQALLQANTRAQKILPALQASTAGSTDATGQRLRQLRLQHNIDPVTLATQACISLHQLKQLETGETSLFYSQSLRNQAIRRIAALLHSHGSHFIGAPTAQTHEKTNPDSMLQHTPPASTQHSQAQLNQDTPHTHNASEHIDTLDKQAAPKLATEQDQEAPAVINPPDESSGLANAFWTMTTWLLCAIAGIACGQIAASYWHLLP